MAMSTERVIGTLNDLVEACKDGEQGFRMAAENIQDQELLALFNSYSRQRLQFADELQREVLRLGGNPEERGSVGGVLHRGWINIKAAVTSRKPAEILSECERGEDVAVSAYQDALAKDLPDDIRAIVESQRLQVQEAHDRVRTLRDAAARQQGDRPSLNY